MRLFQNLMLLFSICIMAGCKEEYYPKVKPSEQSVLVVEGTVNTNGLTNIRLTRSSSLDAGAQPFPEGGATVTVEGESGSTFLLYDSLGNGNYRSDQLSLDASEKYRLHIITQGKEYASDYMTPQKNPPIDSVSWKQDASGVTIYVNTHDPQNNTRYYRWEYEETWLNRSADYAFYKLVNGQPVERQLPEEQVYNCWKNNNSSELLLGSTTKLAQDIVSEKKLISIPAGSDRISERYSVLVRQFALTKEGYEFYELMKKNTESLGSIFDAQPSEITGNIHALSDSSEKVIGFVNIVPGQELRIFISNHQVPNWNFQLGCFGSILVDNNPDSIQRYFGSGDYYPFATETFGGQITGYYGAHPECVDCTLRGGTTQQPSFW